MKLLREYFAQSLWEKYIWEQTVRPSKRGTPNFKYQRNL